MGFGFLWFLLIMSLFFKDSSPQDQPNTDGYYLSEFFNHMGLPHNKSAPICSWQGVVFCDVPKQNHVLKLVVSGLGLSGSIPDTTIGKLTNLQSIDLSNNRITTLPSDFWSLGSLKTLNLSNNKISGSLPSNIGNFGSLETIDLSGNSFSGEIPAALSSLVNLRVLNLNGNGFQWSIPPGIVNCQYLVSIDLSSNKLNGSLPDRLSSAFPNLKSLNLAGNQIHGKSTDFSNMKSVTNLNISGNLFQGSVMGVFDLNLEVIDLSRNQFQGHISQVNFNWSNLVYLDLSENELSGESGDIFHGLNTAKNLKHLNLGYNRMSRQAFPNIKTLSSLQYLNMSSNNLVGGIPNEISQLNELNTIDLSLNHLVSVIPSLSTEKLKVLDVSSNNLTGEIPLSILKKLHGMERFNFSFNNLTLCGLGFPPETLRASFYGSSSSCPIAVEPNDSKKTSSKGKGLELALALALSMICLIGLLIILFSCRKKSKMWEVKQASYREEVNPSGPFSFQTDSTTWVADVKQATSVQVVIFEKPLLNITFADLLSATSNFDRGTLLAEGKFGPVYRGFLPGGIHVAVKVLVHGSTLTDQEAAKELEHLGRIKHANLVPLTGYCLAGDQRIAIYDYMEHGNLQNLLHDLPLGLQITDDWTADTWDEENNNDDGIRNVGSEGLLTTWRFRHKIALGTARALAFLHHGCHPPIIHRDIKASSVYLDLNLEPRLSDFGLAKIFGNGLDDEISHGSPGYVPPEFLQPECDSPTAKSDVYCFGVVLFELVTGKKPIGNEYPDANLVDWVRGLVRKNEGSSCIDPKIRDTGPNDQMLEALKIGYLCTADLPSKRPSMQQIVGLLKDIEPKPHQLRTK